MRKTGLSTNGGKGIGIKTFEDFKKNNIEAMEISLESQEYENVDWKAVEKFSRDT